MFVVPVFLASFYFRHFALTLTQRSLKSAALEVSFEERSYCGFCMMSAKGGM